MLRNSKNNMEEWHFVRAIKLGATQIEFCDNYCTFIDQVKREVQINKNLGNIAYNARVISEKSTAFEEL